MSRMQTNTVMTAMNQLSNHDHSRFLTRTNQMVGRIQTAGPEKAGQNIKPVCSGSSGDSDDLAGSPTLYYGDEPESADGRIRTAGVPIHGGKRI